MVLWISHCLYPSKSLIGLFFLFLAPSLFHQLEFLIIFLSLSTSVFYCILLLFFFFFNVFWSFSHIWGTISNPKDNYAWLTLWESKPSTQKDPSLPWKETNKNPKVQVTMFNRAFFGFRRGGEFPNSEWVKSNDKTSRFVPFRKASAHS